MILTFPKIIVRLSSGDPADGLYRVIHTDALSPPSCLCCVNKHGVSHFFYLYVIRSYTRDECIFFRGPMAELMNILYFKADRSEELSYMTQKLIRNSVKRVEQCVPIDLWSDASLK